MKNLNQNSLGIVLTIGIPTAVALLGLLWILRRKKDDKDDDEASATAKENSVIGDHAAKEKDSGRLTPEHSGYLEKPDLTEKVVQEGGDTAAHKSSAAQVTAVNISCRPQSQKDPQQRLKKDDKGPNQREYQSSSLAQSAPGLESSPAVPSAVPLQSVQGSPVAEKMVAQSSSLTSQGCWQSSSATSSAGTDAQSVDCVELSLQSDLSLIVETSSVVTAQMSDGTSGVEASSSGSPAHNSAQPASSSVSLCSDPAGNGQVSEEIQMEVSSAVYFSQGQTLDVSGSSDSMALGLLNHDNLTAGEESNASKLICPAAQETVAEHFSQNCLSSLSPPLSGLRNTENVQQSEKSEASDADSKESGLIGKFSALDISQSGASEEASSPSAGRLQQDIDNNQFSGSGQTLKDAEAKLISTVEISKGADSVSQKECRNTSDSGVCDAQTEDSNKSVSVQDTPSGTNTFTKDAESESQVSSSVDVETSSSVSTLNSLSSQAIESKGQSMMEGPVSADEQCQENSGTEQKKPGTCVGATENQESNKAEAEDSLNDGSEGGNRETVSQVDVNTGTNGAPEEDSGIVGNQKSSVEEDSDGSSGAVIVAEPSADSSADPSSDSTGAEATRTESSHKVSWKKMDSKSPVSKNSSSPLKSTARHSKSSSPSKSKQSSPPKTAASAATSKASAITNSDGVHHQPTARDGPAENDVAGKTASAVSENGRMDSGSPICDTNSEASNDSGRGGSVGDTLLSLPSGDFISFDFNFPSELCGRLIGRLGKNIQYLKDRSGASISLTRNPFTPEFQICRVQGNSVEVQRALELIRRKFPLSQFPRLDMVALGPAPAPAPVVVPEVMEWVCLDMVALGPAPAPTPVVVPEVMELSLPEGVSIDVVVTAVINAGQVFIQQPTHPSFPNLERLNFTMNQCYEDPSAPTVPLTEAMGTICASESDGQWYRVEVIGVYPAENECQLKYVDYGGYDRVSASCLRQIRSDFMSLPFQATECFLANITPLQDEEYFSQEAADVLVELTTQQMLQGQVVARGDDSVPFLHLYRVSGMKVLMINREMVNREVVRWIEIL
ncbi:hypothetical protein ACOMHN_051767 [Nucella lapillus]